MNKRTRKARRAAALKGWETRRRRAAYRLTPAGRLMGSGHDPKDAWRAAQSDYPEMGAGYVGSVKHFILW